MDDRDPTRYNCPNVIIVKAWEREGNYSQTYLKLECNFLKFSESLHFSVTRLIQDSYVKNALSVMCL